VSWPRVELRQVMTLDVDRVPVDPTQTYKMVGVYSFGRGLFRRKPILAGDTSYKFFCRLKAEHIVMSQLFGWEGALALSSPEYADSYVSPQFPTFLCDGDSLDRRFLAWLMRRPAFWEDLGTRTKGMGDRRRTLNPDALLRSVIPLPPLSEQQRIVARIEEVAAKIEEARRLRTEAAEEAKAFASSLHLHMAGERFLRLDAFLMLEEVRENVRLGQEYPQVGVKGFGEGLFEKESVDGSQTTYKAFNRLYFGAVVLSQVKGWEGALAVCCSDLSGRYVSPEYRTFRCVPELAKHEYLAVIFATPWFWTQLRNMTRGVGARRERIRPEQFLRIEIPMPTAEQQAWAMPVLASLSDLGTLQAETAAELDAMLPSILDKAFKGEL